MLNLLKLLLFAFIFIKGSSIVNGQLTTECLSSLFYHIPNTKGPGIPSGKSAGPRVSNINTCQLRCLQSLETCTAFDYQDNFGVEERCFLYFDPIDRIPLSRGQMPAFGHNHYQRRPCFDDTTEGSSTTRVTDTTEVSSTTAVRESSATPPSSTNIIRISDTVIVPVTATVPSAFPTIRPSRIFPQLTNPTNIIQPILTQQPFTNFPSVNPTPAPLATAFPTIFPSELQTTPGVGLLGSALPSQTANIGGSGQPTTQPRSITTRPQNFRAAGTFRTTRMGNFDIDTACRSSPRDITFVLDVSGSIRDSNPADRSYDNWQLMINFVRDIVSAIDISPSTNNVAMVLFGNVGQLQWGLQGYSNKADLLQAIGDLISVYDNNSQSTNTQDGLRIMRTQAFNTFGDRFGIENVAIVLTDGVSTISKSNTLTEARQARESGIRIVAVGVTNMIDEDELRGISSPPQRLGIDYFISTAFTNLGTIVGPAILGACQ